MAAPRGNRFWEARTKHGRDKLFASAELLWESCCEYFQWCEDNPLFEDKLVTFQGEATHEPVARMRAMTVSGLCMFLDICVQTWHNWKKGNDKGFVEVCMRAEQAIYNQKFMGASADLLNANIIARDLGLRDKSELDHKSSDGTMTPKPAIDASKLSDAALAELMNAKRSDDE